MSLLPNLEKKPREENLLVVADEGFTAAVTSELLVWNFELSRNWLQRDQGYAFFSQGCGWKNRLWAWLAQSSLCSTASTNCLKKTTGGRAERKGPSVSVNTLVF